MFNLKMKNRKGFTLIEMLIVIGIIVALLAIVSFSYVRLTRPAKISAWQGSIKELQTALAAYANEHGDHYPDSVSSDTDFTTWAQNTGLDKYLEKALVNPFHKDTPVTIGASLESDVDAKDAPTGKAIITYTKTTDSDGYDHYTITYSLNGTTYTVKDSLGS